MVARGADASLTERLRISAAVTFARLRVIPHLHGPDYRFSPDVRPGT